jgi:hypothetical protein
MVRRLSWLPLVAFLFAAPVFAESAREHASAARKAEKSKNWSKALEEWKAAYQLEPNAEFLIGMGDAYANLGDKANAKKQYQAYLADPLSLDTDTVKAKIAGLEKKGGGDDLGLDLTSPARPAAKVAAADPGLDLDLTGPAKPAKGKKEKKGKKPAVAADDLGLDLGPGPTAAKAPAGGDLGLELSPPPSAPKKADPRLAVADLSLELAPPPPKKPQAAPEKQKTADLGLDLPPAKPLAPAKVATADPLKPATPPQPAGPPKLEAKPEQKAIAIAPQPPKKPSAPGISTQPPPPPSSRASSGPGTLAWVAAGVAVVGLGGGAFMYSKASSAQSDLHSSIRSGAAQADLLSTEKSSKTASAALLGVGVAAALAAGALFVF